MKNSLKVAKAHKIVSIFYAIVIVCGIVFSIFEGYMLFTFFALACLTAFHYFVGKGAKLERAWARYSTIGIAILMLFSFPFGTIVAIYLLVNSRDWAITNKVK